jgi:hypothetical protein
MFSKLLILAGALALAVGVTAATGAIPDSGGVTTQFGNHNLNGLYEFQADGAIEADGKPARGVWEVGRFEADGRGNITNGKEYSSLLSSHNEEVIDRHFTFEGTYTVRPDGTAIGQVTVVVAPGVEIKKKLWLIIHSVGKDGIANGFDGGHAEADLGGGTHGNTLSHVGHRIETAK